MGNPKTPIALVALVCWLLAGCGKSPTQGSTQPSITAITITAATTTIAKGLTLQLTATGTESGGSAQNITSSAGWSSSNPSVLTVSATGLVTAVAPGSATIGVLDGSVNQTLAMTVTKAIVTSIAVTGSSSSLAVGLTSQLTATATYTDGTVGSLTTAAWQSSNTAIATVGASGLVTAKSTGPVTITATDSTTGVSGTFQLTVTPPSLQSIAVTGASSSTYTGQTVQLTATGTFSDGSTGNLTATATWSSLSPAVATVSAGLVTGVSAGTAVITASSGGKSGSLTITVAAAGSILVAPTQPQVQLGSTAQVSASNNTGNITSQATWTTSDPTTLTVVSGGPLSGVVTARKLGSATLTATLGPNQTSVTVTVTAAPTSSLAITANPGDSTLSVYTVNNTNGSLDPYTYSVLPGTMVDPVNMLIDPTGQFAYVAVQGGVGVLAITSTSGASTPIGTVTPLAGGFYATTNAPTGLALDPAGAHLYVTDGNQIFAFAVNAGVLTPVSGSPFTNVSVSNFVAVDPLGRYLYSSIGSTGQITAFAISSGGSLQPLAQPVSPSGQTPQGIAFDPSGLYLYVANSGDGTIGSYAIAPGTGELTLINATTVGTQPVALAVSPAGLVYFVDATANTVGSASVNLGTGELTANGSPQSTAASGTGILFDPALNFLYTVEPAATSLAETFSLGSSGNPLWASAVATRAQGAALAFVPGNQTTYGSEYLYSLVSGQGNVSYDIDLTNGTLTNQTNVDGGR